MAPSKSSVQKVSRDWIIQFVERHNLFNVKDGSVPPDLIATYDGVCDEEHKKMDFVTKFDWAYTMMVENECRSSAIMSTLLVFQTYLMGAWVTSRVRVELGTAPASGHGAWGCSQAMTPTQGSWERSSPARIPRLSREWRERPITDNGVWPPAIQGPKIGLESK
ncbi:hypothetical protein CY34DRAFT_757044 [Suillus luteus UH-Slu-Lm8-n1]|uniref:Uncharacterized protein n=1 Tax=Suillus luteus UH-Slu-Lm8-n1 TaxID=930992 RepID=A0A0D0ALF3_9AGAM|nr:hypothetical protein CY34DRAFT_757044 [Suillus luteus UH-Slu-Lm8-n1]